MFAAILNADRSPIDRHSLPFQSHLVWPDGAQHIALLRLGQGGPIDLETSAVESLGGRYWLVGRIRLDGREELVGRFARQVETPSDAQLCLHAYEVWGEAFVDRLAGDFCFALWDAERQRLICVRDQLGVRALFHGAVGRTTLVSDSLDWIADTPGLSRALDDTWIADFLSVGSCLELERTVFAHVRRVPPAHLLAVSSAGTMVRRYWQLGIEEPLYLPDRRLYGERFRELAKLAVADRVGRGRVGISMSGGLDSTTLAACTVATIGNPSQVVAQCTFFARLMPDQEQIFSAQAARHLHVELLLTAGDDAIYDRQWRERGIRTPEPYLSIVKAHFDRELNASLARHAAVWFFGEGPDNALRFDRDAYLSWLWRRGDWRRLAQALWLHAEAKGIAGWTATLRRWLASAPPPEARQAVPPWLNPGVARQGWGDTVARHPWHPSAMNSFSGPPWQDMFAGFDVDESLAPLVWRHPFLDLRLLRFMLSVPPVPWAWHKLLLREAMRGRLPREVLERNKAPLAKEPLVEALRGQSLPELTAKADLERWLDCRKLPEGRAAASASDLTQLLAVHALDYWLSQR